MIIEEVRDRGGTKETTGKKYETLSILFLLRGRKSNLVKTCPVHTVSTQS